MIKYVVGLAVGLILLSVTTGAYAQEGQSPAPVSPERSAKIGSLLLSLTEQYDRSRPIQDQVDRAEALLNLKLEKGTDPAPVHWDATDQAFPDLNYSINEPSTITSGDGEPAVESTGAVFSVYDAGAASREALAENNYSHCLSQKAILPQFLQRGWHITRQKPVAEVMHETLLERPGKASIALFFTGGILTGAVDRNAGVNQNANVLASNVADGCMMIAKVY